MCICALATPISLKATKKSMLMHEMCRGEGETMTTAKSNQNAGNDNEYVPHSHSHLLTLTHSLTL